MVHRQRAWRTKPRSEAGVRQSCSLTVAFSSCHKSPAPASQFSTPRGLKEANPCKTRPTLGDWVLIREMAPNQPEIATEVAHQALNSDSDNPDSDDEDKTQSQSLGTTKSPLGPSATHPVPPRAQPNTRLSTTQLQLPVNDSAFPFMRHGVPSFSQLLSDIPRSAFTSEDDWARTSITRSQTTDIFLRSGSGHIFGADDGRPSQASKSRRSTPTPHSASTSVGSQSPDCPSSMSQQTPIERPRLLSMDGTLASSAIIISPPNGSGLPQIRAHGAGAFRCDYPGCKALPFRTQYLLK